MFQISIFFNAKFDTGKQVFITQRDGFFICTMDLHRKGTHLIAIRAHQIVRDEIIVGPS